MAPDGQEEAEVVIVEGTQVVKNMAIDAGTKLLTEGKAGHMLVVVLHKSSKEDQLFAIQDRYTQLLLNESEKMSPGRTKFQVILAPIGGHPITLAEARFVVAKLSKGGIKSAILLSEGFHTRRSYGVYRQEGVRVGLRIIPCAYFSGYGRDDWWQHAEGVYDFLQESSKLAYYLLRGYLSVEFLWT